MQGLGKAKKKSRLPKARPSPFHQKQTKHIEMAKNCTYCLKRSPDCDKCDTMEKEINEMQDFLEQDVSDDPNSLVEKLTMINVYMARSGRLLAEAKSVQDEITECMFETKREAILSMSPTIASKYIQSKLSNINRLVNLLDRQNRAFVHVGDNLRTQISFAKQDMALQRKGY